MEKSWENKTFLVAEDEKTNYVLIESVLKKTKVKLVWVKNGKDAVEVCRTNPNIDLVIMDIRMPDMNGFEATSKIKQIRHKLPVIVQTAYAKEYESDLLMSKNYDGFLSKPFKPQDLLSSIGKIIN